MEAEAIVTIFKHIESSEWVFISSGIINYEIMKTIDEERRARLKVLARAATEFVPVDEKAHFRAMQIQGLGIKTYDALHIACAEIGKADAMLSTDDKLIKLVKRNVDKIHVKVENPLDWLQEVI